MIPKYERRLRSNQSGISLVEVLVAMAIGSLMMAATTIGFVQCMRRAEWSAYALAANSLALQKIEQTRAASWDSANATNDLVTGNFPTEREILDVSFNKTNIVYATNFTTVLDISTNPPLKMIRVDCVWGFLSRGLFTNTIVTYRAPDS